MKTVRNILSVKCILESESDFVIDLEDTIGQDSYSIWGELGHWEELIPNGSLIRRNKILRAIMRRTIITVIQKKAHYRSQGIMVVKRAGLKIYMVSTKIE